MRRVLRGAALGCGWVVSVAAGQSTAPAVFVANNVSGTVTSFTVNTDGTLVVVGVYDTDNYPEALGLSPDGKHLAVSHGQDEVLEVLNVFRVDSDASLTLVGTGLVPTTPLDLVWLGPDTLAVTESTLIASNHVHTYAFDEANGTITHIDQQFTGSFNTHLALRHDGLFLYAQDSGQRVIRSFEVNSDATLTLASTISTGSLFALDMAITGDDTQLFAASGISGGGHRILGFSVAPDTGSLTPLPASPFTTPGVSPAHVVFSRDDRWLFVGHGTDATVRSFEHDATTGAITATGFSFDVGLQGSIGDVARLGDLLFVTDETTAIDGIAGIYSFSIQSNGSFTVNDGIFQTQGVRPESVATWSPIATGDADGDGDVDLFDFSEFAQCVVSQSPSEGSACPLFDFDGDNDVDWADFAGFQRAFTG